MTTPGPWKVILSKAYPTVRIIGPKGQALASFGNQQRWMRKQEVWDNAQLMAAALELLSACKSAMEYIALMERQPQVEIIVYEGCRQAIKKATGIDPSSGTLPNNT